MGRTNGELIPVSKKTTQSLGIVSVDPKGTFRFLDNRWMRVYEVAYEPLSRTALDAIRLLGRMRITLHMSGDEGRETCLISLMEWGENYESVKQKFMHDEAVLEIGHGDVPF